MIINPTIFENDGLKERGYDPFSRILKDRVVLIFNDINDDLACTVIAQLLYLQALDPAKEITIYINSYGGSVSAGLAIYDTIKMLSCDVKTICVGMAASMGAFLLSSGAKGKRYALPNSTIMIHQPSAGTQGQITDMKLHLDYYLKNKERLNHILANNTGKSYEQICIDTERDNFMFAEEALEYGLFDEIVTNKKDK